jgi:predicted porin
MLYATGPAFAQSSVTLYGRIDSGVEYMSGVPTGPANGAATGTTTRVRAESGNWAPSVWGLKGVEDIGGGTSVLFHLESGINAVTGAGPGGGELFNRWATVGVQNTNYGTLLLGRQFFISNDLWDFDPFGMGNWSAVSLVRGRNWPFTSNSVSYQSPKIGGFEIHGQYSLSNATSWNGNGTTPQGRQDGIAITYTAALFQVRAIYDEIRDSANGGLDSVFAASREYFAGANVFLGQFKLQAAYQASRTSGVAFAPVGTPTTTDQEWAGLTWQATPAASLIGAVYHVNANNGGGNATLYSIGGSYSLSKRTELDLQVASVRNAKNSNFALNPNNPGTEVSTDNPLVGHSQSGVYASIEHRF